jgi:hypothetical protein
MPHLSGRVTECVRIKMYEVGSYFGLVLLRCVFSAILMIQVVFDTTPCWLVNVFHVSKEPGASTLMVVEPI